VKTEKQTRQQIIDQQLLQAGWDVSNTSQVIKEFEIDVNRSEMAGVLSTAEPSSKYQGYQYSDYVFLGKNGKPLAVVEAKKTTKDPASGLEQAKQYC
jgi:type I restriction enzyme, R subunit